MINLMIDFNVADIVAALALLGAIIGSYVRLGSRITKLEAELSNYKDATKKLEKDSDEHHEALLGQVAALKDSIYTVKELIISSNSKFEVLQASITSLHKSSDQQDQRILYLEQLQHESTYNKPSQPSRRKRR